MEDHMIKEEKLERKVINRIFLISLKYIPHIIALLYAIYTICSFKGLDLLWAGHLTHLSILPWIFMYLASYTFKYCYVHRLPLYYIGINELLTNLDYYIGIPIETINLFLIHLSLLVIVIFGYSIYYIKYKL